MCGFWGQVTCCQHVLNEIEIRQIMLEFARIQKGGRLGARKIRNSESKPSARIATGSLPEKIIREAAIVGLGLAIQFLVS